MKKLTFLIPLFFLSLLGSSSLFAQAEMVIPPSNRSTASLEKNLLFFAPNRYTVSQSGSVSLPLNPLFDGSMTPVYSYPLNSADPYVILIENLPNIHSQEGGWIGWSTRYYNPKRFKVEAFSIWGNTWVTVAEEVNYGLGSYMVKVPALSVGKIRFTFYEGTGPSGAIGLSELFYIHQEASRAYDGLMVQYNEDGNVGIGTASPKEKLSVNGKIRAHEIKVETANWPDYVFAKDYQLPSLAETEKHIKEKGHLPGIPSAEEVKSDGIDLGDMNAKLLQKIEELTLLLIEEHKTLKEQVQKLDVQGKKIEQQQMELNQLKRKR